MRWKSAKRQNTDTRVKRKFLFIPRTFDGETRWLEFANIKEDYVQYLVIEDWGPDFAYGWCETGFAD